MYNATERGTTYIEADMDVLGESTMHEEFDRVVMISHTNVTAMYKYVTNEEATEGRGGRQQIEAQK